jgi:PAS domain S-box-containing protein
VASPGAGRGAVSQYVVSAISADSSTEVRRTRPPAASHAIEPHRWHRDCSRGLLGRTAAEQRFLITSTVQKRRRANGDQAGVEQGGEDDQQITIHQEALLAALEALASGDFTIRLASDRSHAAGDISRAFNDVAELSERTSRELRRTSRIVGRHGHMAVRASIPGAVGGWARNVEALNDLVTDLTEPAIQVSRVLGAVAAGDLTRRMSVDVNGRPLRGEFRRWADLVNTMVDQLNAFASEVTRVAREVGTEGKLGGQADVRGVGGTWKDLTDSVNFMAGNLTGQVRNIAEVTTAVAQGDLSKKITVDVQGEILELKNTINTMVDQLNAFASEVTRVAREVGTEGKLGGQADVRGVGGTWKDLTDSVNLLAANLTTQVRAIGEVATAVTRGDLSRSIEVAASGEVEILKDDINEMIRRLRDTTRENAEQVWLKTNLARFSSLLQGQRDPETVGQLILSELAPLIGVLSGVMYARDDENGAGRLTMIASYARQRSSVPPTHIAFGEGLIGQCASLRKTIVVREAPHDYIAITSALGEAAPHMIVVLPVLFEDAVQGVIELASFDPFTDVQLDFLDQLSETVGIVLHTIVANTRAEAFLREQAARAEAEAGLARLRQVVDAMPEGIMLADASGSVYLHNAAAVEIMGRIPENVLTDTDDMPEVRRLDGSTCPARDQPLARAILRQEVVRGDQLIVTNGVSGEDVPILVNSVPLSDASEEQAGGVVVFQDITPLHELDRQRDEFLSAVSHDLRNPVAIIRGRTELLQRSIGRSTDMTKLSAGLAAIDTSTVRLVRMVDELLDLTRVRMGHPIDLNRTPTDLGDLVRRTADEYRSTEPERELVVDIEADGLVGEWDATRIERVLDNLLSNAIKYSEPGSRIRVAASDDLRQDGRWAVLAVSNTGHGIPAAEVDQIFDTYYRASNVAGSVGGTGVGLAGARHIVEQHGGTIGVESVEGGTTTFTIHLPMSASG